MKKKVWVNLYAYPANVVPGPYTYTSKENAENASVCDDYRSNPMYLGAFEVEVDTDDKEADQRRGAALADWNRRRNLPNGPVRGPKWPFD